jgi:hypothetical protein
METDFTGLFSAFFVFLIEVVPCNGYFLRFPLVECTTNNFSCTFAMHVMILVLVAFISYV